MDSNTIYVYKNNSKEVIVTIDGISVISGYTAIMTIKKNLYDEVEVASITGTTNQSALTASFSLLPVHTNHDAGIYHYDVVLSDLTNNYTIVQSNLQILESVRY